MTQEELDNMVKTKEWNIFVDKDFAYWCSTHNIEWNDSNFFVDDSVTSLSNCCRLKSNIKDLGYFNSIGGTALKVGSIKVSTINLARIALEAKNEDDYIERLKDRLIVEENGYLTLKGKAKPVLTYNVIGLKDDVKEDKNEENTNDSEN